METSLRVVLVVCSLAMAASLSHAATLSISELEDIDFGTTIPSLSSLEQQIRFCVSLTPRGPFMITATGNGTAGAFAMPNISGGGWEIGYGVRIRGRDLIPGVPASGLRAGPPDSAGQCRPPRFLLTITLDAAEVSNAPAGQYRGQLQLTVAPE